MVEVDSVPGAGGTQTAQVIDEEMIYGGPHIALPATDLKVADTTRVLCGQFAEQQMAGGFLRPGIVFNQ